MNKNRYIAQVLRTKAVWIAFIAAIVLAVYLVVGLVSNDPETATETAPELPDPYAYIVEGKPKEAGDAYLQLADTQNDGQKAQNQELAGDAYFDTGEYLLAKDAYMKAATTYEALGQTNDVSRLNYKVETSQQNYDFFNYDDEQE
jgi:hypothetical protein